jgi:hypothetical protein
VFSGFYNRTLVTQSQEEGAPTLTDGQLRLLDAIDEITDRPEVHVEPSRSRHLLRLWLEVPEIEALVSPDVRYQYRYGRTGIPAG